MQPHTARTFLFLFLALAASPALPCTGFMAHDASAVLVGNNEDFFAGPSTMIWFEPPSGELYGFVGWRYDFSGMQGGMNDQGLFWDGFATPFHDIENDTGTIPLAAGTNIELMRRCATVDEAIAFLRLHHLSETFQWSQLFLADRSGNSAIFEGDTVIEPTGNYQICTNFLQSQPELGGYPCWRYDTVESMMETGLELTMDYFRDMAEAAHQGTDTDSTIYTRYTTVCDLVSAQCRLYYDLDYDNFYLIDLEAELALGYHEAMMADIFNPPAEAEEEPEPVVEAEPDAAEEAGPEEVEQETVEEPPPDTAADPDIVPGDPVAETEEGGETPEKCEGCGCRVAGSGSTAPAGAVPFFLLLAFLLLAPRPSAPRRASRLLVILLSLLLATGCGKDCHEIVDTGVDNMTDPDVETVQEADAEDLQDPDAEEVQEEDLPADEIEETGLAFIVLEPGETADELLPVEGATVAFDAPFMERVEKRTGADGKAWFGQYEWTEAVARVSAHKDGYAIISFLNLNADSIGELGLVDGAPALLIQPLGPEPPAPVTVGGTALNLLDASHPFMVGVLRSPLSRYQAATWSGESTETFSVSVARGEPFTLLGVETQIVASSSTRGFDQAIYRVMQHDFDAIDENLEDVVLDFAADEVSVVTADLAIAMPARTASPLRSGNGECAVSEATSQTSIGWGTAFDFDPAAGRMEVSFAWVEPPWAEGVTTYCWVYSEDWGSYNVFGWLGFPDEGDPDLMLDAPEWRSLPYPYLAIPLHSNLRWNLFDSGAGIELAVARQGQTFWKAYPGRDATELTLPEPPSSVDWASDFGMETVYGSLSLYMLDETGRVVRFTQPQTITLAP